MAEGAWEVEQSVGGSAWGETFIFSPSYEMGADLKLAVRERS